MYIAPRHRRYWAYHDIPQSLHAKMGRKRFWANLKTRDRATAEIRAALLKAEWLAAIESARNGTDLELNAISLRAALIRSELDCGNATDQIVIRRFARMSKSAIKLPIKLNAVAPIPGRTLAAKMSWASFAGTTHIILSITNDGFG